MMRKKQGIFRIAVMILLLIALLVSSSAGVSGRLDRAGLNRLYITNQVYIESSLNQALTTFAVLSGIKIGLAILEGSEFGVGFGIEVGDAVQSAYDYVDIAWRTVLASAAILMGTQYLLKTAQILDNWFLSIALLCLLIKLMLQWFIRRGIILQRIFRDLGLLMATITVTLFFVLPLSIWGGSRLSQAITSPSLKSADAGISRIRTDLFPEEENGKTGLLKQLQKTRDKLHQVSAAITTQTRELSLYVLKIIAGYIFDTVIFPLALFLFFYWLIRTGSQYIFNVQKNQSLRADLETIIIKYFGKVSSS